MSITHARVERCTVTQAQELRSEPLQTMVLPARCSPAGLTGICMSLIRHRPKTDRLWTMALRVNSVRDLFSAGNNHSPALPFRLCWSRVRDRQGLERAFERVCALQTAHMDHLFERQRALAFSLSPLLLASMHAIHFSVGCGRCLRNAGCFGASGVRPRPPGELPTSRGGAYPVDGVRWDPPRDSPGLRVGVGPGGLRRAGANCGVFSGPTAWQARRAPHSAAPRHPRQSSLCQCHHRHMMMPVMASVASRTGRQRSESPAGLAHCLR